MLPQLDAMSINAQDLFCKLQVKVVLCIRETENRFSLEIVLTMINFFKKSTPDRKQHFNLKKVIGSLVQVKPCLGRAVNIALDFKIFNQKIQVL
jgi:hypothetical protein